MGLESFSITYSLFNIEEGKQLNKSTVRCVIAASIRPYLIGRVLISFIRSPIDKCLYRFGEASDIVHW